MGLPATSSSSIKLANGQADFTKSVSAKSKGPEGILQELQKQNDDFVQLIIKQAQCPSFNPDSQQDLLGPLAALKGAQAVALQTEAIIDASNQSKEAAALQKSSMCGQTVHIDGSKKAFSGPSVSWEFEVSGKNIPAATGIQGTVVILDEEGNKVYRKKLNQLALGKNLFNWDGKGLDEKTLPHGNYKIEVEAYYEVVNANGTRKSSLIVDLDTEGIIERVDVETGDVIISGKKVPFSSIKSFSKGSKTDVKSSEQGNFTDYNSFLGKTVSIEQNQVSFSGGNTTPVTFFSDAAHKEAFVEIWFSKDGKHVSVAKKFMPIAKGQNNFNWNGLKTETLTDVEKLSEGKESFSSVPKGTYEYEVRVIPKGESMMRLENKRTIHVDGIERDSTGTDTYIVSGKDKFNTRSIKRITETHEHKAKRSATELQAEASKFPQKTAQVAIDVLEYNKTPMTLDLFFPFPKAGDSVTKGSVAITDQDGVVLKTIELTEDEVRNIVDRQRKIYSALKPESKGILNWWIGQQNWANGTEQLNTYEKAITTHQAEIEQRMLDDHTLERWWPYIQTETTWDGTNNEGKHLGAGKYKFKATWDTLINRRTGTTTSPTQLPITVTSATSDPEHESILLTLQNGKTIKLEDVLGWA